MVISRGLSGQKVSGRDAGDLAAVEAADEPVVDVEAVDEERTVKPVCSTELNVARVTTKDEAPAGGGKRKDKESKNANNAPPEDEEADEAVELEEGALQMGKDGANLRDILSQL